MYIFHPQVYTLIIHPEDQTIYDFVQMCANIRYESFKSLPIQSVLQVPIQKLWPLKGTKREWPVPFFSASFKGKVLQLQLANAASGFVLRRLSAFPQQNQQNLWWLGLCVMYYVALCTERKRGWMLHENSTEIIIPLHDW